MLLLLWGIQAGKPDSGAPTARVMQRASQRLLYAQVRTRTRVLRDVTELEILPL